MENQSFGVDAQHKNHGKPRQESPRTKVREVSAPFHRLLPFLLTFISSSCKSILTIQPMILSRRTSYKIANASPRGHSPIVASELRFDSPARKKSKSATSANPVSK